MLSSIYSPKRVGARESFDIYSRDWHLKPEKQKVPGDTVCPPCRFQRPTMEIMWKAEHKQYGSSVSRSQSMQYLH